RGVTRGGARGSSRGGSAEGRGRGAAARGAGSFEPLAAVPEGKIAVLGLVTTKSGRRETVAELAARIEEASAFCPLEQLALSPQCGFATSVLGNDLTVDDERAKLRVIAQTAAEGWS